MLSVSKLITTSQFHKKSYFKFLTSFKKLGYNFISYKQIKKKNNILLRHDVDFSVDLAKKIAIWDHKQGIKSHFFFQYDSPFYNLGTHKNIENLKLIKKLKHSIGFHISIKNFNTIRKDLLIFEKFLKVNGIKFNKIFSIHKIGSKKYNIKIPGYQNFFNFNSLGIYYSDSGGSFRFGNPLNNNEIIINKSSFQLNLHPIWWTSGNKIKKSNKIKNIKKLTTKIFDDELKTYRLL
tara:strand:+ start:826 stop:1530 length:705 start_codon:yes stop_codon:yes gene_type:complete